MAKLSRESRLRERRAEKQARKVARRQAAAGQSDLPSEMLSDNGESARPGAEQPAGETVDPTVSDA